MESTQAPLQTADFVLAVTFIDALRDVVIERKQFAEQGEYRDKLIYRYGQLLANRNRTLVLGHDPQEGTLWRFVPSATTSSHRWRHVS